MSAGKTYPPFPSSPDTKQGDASQRGPEQKPAEGQTAPAGEFFGADNPVENVPFAANVSRV